MQIEEKSHQTHLNYPSRDKPSLFFEKTTLKCCPNPSDFLKFVRTRDGKEIAVPCGKYSCEYCGQKKAQKLYSALNRYFGQFKYVRLWTFTLSSRVAPDKITHYKIFAECWRRLITELRRNKVFSKKQHKFQYVRVCEPHKSGFFHYHCIFTEYFKQELVQKIWEGICQEVTKDKFHVAQCNVKGCLSSKGAARYVSKYVLKSAKLLYSHQKKWTKSVGASIFDKKVSSGEWSIMMNSRKSVFDIQSNYRNFTLNSSQFLTTSQNFETNFHDPPDISAYSSAEIDYFVKSIREKEENLIEFSENLELENFEALQEWFSMKNIDDLY